MTDREAFDEWYVNVGQHYSVDVSYLRECFFDACAWQREKDAEIVAGTDLLPGQSASQEYAYDFVARYLNDIAEAIRQGDE